MSGTLDVTGVTTLSDNTDATSSTIVPAAVLDVASVLSDNVVAPVTPKVPPIAASVPTFIFLATARPPDTIVPAQCLM